MKKTVLYLFLFSNFSFSQICYNSDKARQLALDNGKNILKVYKITVDHYWKSKYPNAIELLDNSITSKYVCLVSDINITDGDPNIPYKTYVEIVDANNHLIDKLTFSQSSNIASFLRNASFTDNINAKLALIKNKNNESDSFLRFDLILFNTKFDDRFTENLRYAETYLDNLDKTVSNNLQNSLILRELVLDAYFGKFKKLKKLQKINLDKLNLNEIEIYNSLNYIFISYENLKIADSNDYKLYQITTRQLIDYYN